MDDVIAGLNAMKLNKFREKMSVCSLHLLHKLKLEFDNRYYNTGEETIDDLKFDILIEVLKERDPSFFLSIGCKLREGDNKVPLPFALKGMDKIKKGEDDKLENWKTKHKANSYVLSDKLNGVSCLIVFTKAKVSLYTRGDGVEGADISYLYGKIKNIPNFQDFTVVPIAVRGELIIKDAVYNEKWKKEYKNSLSLIVSVVNSKTLKEAIKDIEFVAYEIVVSKRNDYTIEKQFQNLQRLGFKTPYHKVVDSFTSSSLSDLLHERKEQSEYDIDGIIVHDNSLYDRTDVSSTGNPSYAFAFKMLLEVATATVNHVEWNQSKWGVLKPRICIEPVNLCGITICHTTGFNAGFIRDKKINTGSKLLITRSGDIIPYIVQVLSESEHGPSMPDITCEWNETNVDLVCKEEDNEVQIQKLVHFFVSIGVKQINEGVVRKLYENNLDTIAKIVSAKKEDFLKVPTIKEKMAERLLTNLKSGLSSVKLTDFLTGSGIFGMGIAKKKLDALLTVYPERLTKIPQYSEHDICKVAGFSLKTAKKIIKGIPQFNAFLDPLKNFISFEKKEISIVGDKFKDKKFVFSKFRDEGMKQKIIALGGSVSDSVSSKTYAVVCSNKNDVSGKIEKARANGVLILSKDELEMELG